MAVKIRLKRLGKRNNPFYRLVVVDSRWRRDGKTISNIGWYDPVKQPAQLSLKEVEIYQWLEKGAQLSETARSLLKKQGIIERFRSGKYKEIVASGEAPTASKTLTVGDSAEAAPAPVVEEPKVEEPKVEEPKVEEPKVEEPKVEEPKEEAPAVEASSEESSEEPKTEG
ncbi:MAG: 30S ribosomal protein S16 [Candidatus Omnitrophica bacterium]|nr:30S ribosomal protein S16 [Candidatus Omnitrophota bacterium]